MNKKILIILLCVISSYANAQSWNALRGGNQRNNLSPQFGLKVTETPLWVVDDAAFTGFGGNIYTFGDRFVITRWNLSIGKSIVECRNLHTGELLWVSPDFGPTSKLHVTAFNEDAVYVHDYDDNIMMFHALDPENGHVKWSHPSFTFGPQDSPIFDYDRNPVINTSLDDFNEDASLIRSVDKDTGETLWVLQEFVVILPNRLKAAYGNTLYMVTGSAVDPKKLIAVDLRNGSILYYSDPIPGQGSQQSSPFIGPDGTIYVFRDGGDLFAFTDTGSGFEMKWQHTPQNVTTLMIPAVEVDGNIIFVDNGQVKRLSHINGEILATSLVNNLPLWSSLLATRDSMIHISNGGNAYMALSYDLQNVLWTETNTGNNTYALPNLSYNGTMIMAGNGTVIKAFRNNQPHPPVAEFLASVYHINAGQSIEFSDFSSYQPTSWEWTFEGGSPATSTQQNPIVTYNQPGHYSVSLVVHNALGSDTLIKEYYVKVDQGITNLLEFVILDTDGQSIPGAVITVNEITNQPGDYLFELEPGTYDYNVTKDGYIPLSGEFVMGNENQSITLIMEEIPVNTYLLEFIILDTHGQQITDAVITVNEITNQPGDYSFELEPDTYDYNVTKDGYFPLSGEVVIENEDQTLTLVMEMDNTSINIESTNEISVFPNPTKEYVMINAPGDINTIRILSIYGHEVLRLNIGASETTSMRIDLNGLNAGIYVIQFVSSKQVFNKNILILK
jgi:PKD repeat protein